MKQLSTSPEKSTNTLGALGPFVNRRVVIVWPGRTEQHVPFRAAVAFVLVLAVRADRDDAHRTRRVRDHDRLARLARTRHVVVGRARPVVRLLLLLLLLCFLLCVRRSVLLDTFLDGRKVSGRFLVTPAMKSEKRKLIF